MLPQALTPGPASPHSALSGTHPAPFRDILDRKTLPEKATGRNGHPRQKTDTPCEPTTTGKNGHTRTDMNDRPLWPRPRQPDARHRPLSTDTPPGHTPSSGGFSRSFPILPAPSFPGGSGQLRPPAFSSPATSPDTGFSAPTLLRYYLPEKIHKKTGQTWKNRHAGRFFPPVSPSHGRSRHWTMKTTS